MGNCLQRSDPSSSPDASETSKVEGNNSRGQRAAVDFRVYDEWARKQLIQIRALGLVPGYNASESIISIGAQDEPISSLTK